jgi:hypothetical protein
MGVAEGTPSRFGGGWTTPKVPWDGSATPKGKMAVASHPFPIFFVFEFNLIF